MIKIIKAMHYRVRRARQQARTSRDNLTLPSVAYALADARASLTRSSCDFVGSRQSSP